MSDSELTPDELRNVLPEVLATLQQALESYAYEELYDLIETLPEPTIRPLSDAVAAVLKVVGSRWMEREAAVEAAERLLGAEG